MLWFKLFLSLSPLFCTHYHTLLYTREKKIKIEPSVTLNYNKLKDGYALSLSTAVNYECILHTGLSL